MKEKDLMQDLLTTEKQVISAYSTGITETSCPNLRNTLVNNFQKSQNCQYQLFDTMNKKGWYPVKDATVQEVQEAKTQANEMMNEI